MEQNKKPVYWLSYDHGGYILFGDKFAERLSTAASWMRKYPKFKFGLDNEAFTYDAYAKENPLIMDKIRKMLKLYPGRFGIGTATYGQPLSAFIDHESNVRQLTYSLKACEQHFGVRPYVYAMSEHAMHAQIPQLVKDCGYDMAMMRTHFQMYGFNPTYPVSFGTWVGMDGSRIPTVPTYDEQGAHFGRTTIDNWILTRWPHGAEESPEDFENMFSHIHPLLGSRYDDAILRCEEASAFAEEKDNYHWVILEDLADIYRGYEDQMDFVTKPGDFTLRMPWGYCGNVIFRMTVKAQDLVRKAERIAAIAKLLGEDCDKGDIEAAWKGLLIAQHHDVQICGLVERANTFLGDSIAASERVISRSMKAIATALGGDERQNLLVFNPSASKSKQRVTAVVGGRNMGSVTAVCGDVRIPCRVAPMQYNDNGDIIRGARVSFVCELEGLEAKVFTFEPGEAQRVEYTYDNGVLTAGDYEITLAQSGISSIVKKDGRVVLKDGHITGTVDKKPCSSEGVWTVYTDERGVSAKQVGLCGVLPFSIELTVDPELDSLQFTLSTEHHGEEVGIPKEYDSFWNNRNGFVHEDKLRFVFTPGIEAEKAYGVYTHPFVIGETDEMYIEGNDLSAYSDGEKTLLLRHDGGKCLTREGENLSIPLAFSHRYAWGVKALWGRYENAFSLSLLCGCDKAGLLSENERYHLPFEASVFEKTPVGITATSARPLTVNLSENAAVSALYPTEKGVGIRLWETLGKEAEASVETELPYLIKYTDLLGNAVPASGLTPHKIITMELSLEE